MSHPKELPFSVLQFYATAPYPCSYIEGQQARSQVATPAHLINSDIYSELIKTGFRRSGAFTYRPYCDHCRACTPVRVPVNQFKPNRIQRRVKKAHENLYATAMCLEFHKEHFELYSHYQHARHMGGGMDQDNHEQYSQFLLTSHINTRLVEFRDPDGILRIVSILDMLSDGLSSVYTFFDPQQPHTSYGTYAILWQIEQCFQLGLPYLYLGYWIGQSQKMSYKARFKPIEAFQQNQWHPLKENT